MALALALIVLMALSTLGLGFLATASHEPLIARNHADTARARYVAEAGLEWALDTLRTAVEHTPAGNRIPVSSFATTTRALPGLDTRAGAFTVTIRNDARPTDPQFTGRTQDGTDESLDGNNVAIVTSTGRVGTATKTLMAVFRGAVACVEPDGAVNLPGKRVTVSVGTSDHRVVEIDGHDTRLDGTRGDAPAKYGISVSSERLGSHESVPHEQRVEWTAVNWRGHRHLSRILGRPQDVHQPGEGKNTIATTDGITMQNVTECVDAIKSNVDNALAYGSMDMQWRVKVHPDCNYRIREGTSFFEPEQACFGTPDRPRVTYISGIHQEWDHSYDPMRSRPFVHLPFRGWGPLIIEGVRNDLLGELKWNGPVIITGPTASIVLRGNADVLGTLVVNYTRDVPHYYADTPIMFDPSSPYTHRIRYRREVLERTFTCRYNPALCAVLYGWREL